MNRLQLTLTSVPINTAAGGARAFDVALYITVLVYAVEAYFFALSFYSTSPEGMQNGAILHNIFNLIYGWFSVVVVLLLRRAVRKNYNIPGHCFRDFWCTLWCRCCVLGQMLRHTTDYDVYPSRVCTSNGQIGRAHV